MQFLRRRFSRPLLAGWYAAMLCAVACATKVAAMDGPVPLPTNQTAKSLIQDLKLPIRSSGISVATGQPVDPEFSSRTLEYQPFQRHTLMKISSSGTGLDIGRAPMYGSAGIFAYDGTKLLYLGGKDKRINIETLLRQEALSLETMDEKVLARFFSQTFLGSGYGMHVIITCSNDLLDFQKQYYRVDPEEFDHCSNRLAGPSLTGNADVGWKLHFVTLNGSMTWLQNVTAYDITVSPNYDVSVCEQVLSKRIFSVHPHIML
jgi:hypothetical protein